jgi:hypothetical protein
LVISEAVLAEVRLGDQSAALARLAYCEELSMVAGSDQVEAIVKHLLCGKAIAQKAFTDAVHIAIAAADIEVIARCNIEVAPRKFADRVPIIARPGEILESLP